MAIMTKSFLSWTAILLLAQTATAWASGCSWSGRMLGPGSSGACPSPTGGTCPVTPSYQELRARGQLWRCPNADQAAGQQYYGSCVRGSGSNPLCKLNPYAANLGCCCPENGCWTPPQFNWIIAVCKGSSCGGYNSAPATQRYKNAGSELIVNYAASYQWDGQHWQLVKNSSFNTDGSRPEFDTMKPNGGMNASEAWLQPRPGGAADWSWGYYPAGVRGAGPPGMLFVLSVESVWNIAWYMLNQVTLDKGPVIGYQPNSECKYGNSNCWASGNSGEIDFLEAPWTVNEGAADGYRRLYATQFNQVGRSFIGDGGSTCNADGGWFGDVTSNNYFLGTVQGKRMPYVFAAVVDRIGTFIYRIPGADSDKYWPGLSRKTAACTLGARPYYRPTNNGPPCDDSNPYCALFLPNCQSASWGGAAAGDQGGPNQGCKVNEQQGWCQNWWLRFANTGQWLWPANGRKSVTQFQSPAAPVVNPWNYEMEAWKVTWNGAPVGNGGCCVVNQGHCPKALSRVRNETQTMEEGPRNSDVESK